MPRILHGGIFSFCGWEGTRLIFNEFEYSLRNLFSLGVFEEARYETDDHKNNLSFSEPRYKI